jgi:hypothetical protein
MAYTVIAPVLATNFVTGDNPDSYRDVASINPDSYRDVPRHA